MTEHKSEKDTVIISDLEYLSKPCEPVADIKEGEEIAARLFRVITDKQEGAGLAANQIGINKCVCVVNVKEPLYFINPRYEPVEESGKFVYLERCLSFPGRVVRTERWREIKIIADNFAAGCMIDISNIPTELIMQSADAFELACIQHEINHLHGLTMFDNMYKPLPVTAEHEIGRNEKVKIQNGKEIIEIKYKKFPEFKKAGWKVIE